MNNTEARIRELNHAKRLLVDFGRAPGARHSWGLKMAVMILMERKKQLRASLNAARGKVGQ